MVTRPSALTYIGYLTIYENVSNKQSLAKLNQKEIPLSNVRIILMKEN